MKMKGHTTIELTDVNTGEKEVHQDDNLVTNALSWLLNKSCGIFCNNPVASAIGPGDALVKACTGGVFLFKEPLEEDVNTVYAPIGAELVGCGSGIPYTGALDLAGSYNAIESGFSDDGMSYKHVWDFNTSQANGRISCVCLTTQAGGKVTPGVPYFDEGYKLDGEATFVAGTKIIQLPKKENGQSASFSSLLWFDLDGGRLFIDRSNYGNNRALTTTMVIDKYRASFHNAVSLWESTFGQHGDNLEGTVSVEMPQGLIDAVNADSGNDYYYNRFTEGNKLYVFPKKYYQGAYDIDVGKRINVWRIDLDALEGSFLTVENRLPMKIRYSPNNVCALTFGDYLFVIGDDLKMYRINMVDPSDYSTVKLQDGSDLQMVDAYFRYPCYHAGRLLFSYGNFTCSVDPQYCVASFRNENVVRQYLSLGDFLVGQQNNYMVPYIDPCVLVTINNLQTPVVKTASQSMKVTYTIGFGEG